MFESLNKFAYTMFAGKPVLMWTGVLMLILILATGLFAYLYSKRILAPKSYKLHKWFGLVTIIVGLFHALLGFAKYLM